MARFEDATSVEQVDDQGECAGQTGHRFRGFLRRRRTPAATADLRTDRLRRLADVCSVLEGARAVVERGWLQDRWYSGGREPKGPDHSGGAACLVGAVVSATRTANPKAELIDAAPALDLVWDAWQESRGLNGPGVAGRAAPPQVRAARIRDLAAWNDRPGRTRGDVLRLLDLAITRAIMEAANTPPARSDAAAGSRY